MAIQDLMAPGVGFGVGKVQYILTRGLDTGTSVPSAVLEWALSETLQWSLADEMNWHFHAIPLHWSL